MTTSREKKESKDELKKEELKTSSLSSHASSSVFTRTVPVIQDINIVFASFIKMYSPEKQSLLTIKKNIILESVLSNLGMKKKEYYSEDELRVIENELPKTVYMVGNRLMDLMPSDEKLEAPTTLEKNASNLVKHLIFGVLAGEDDADILKSHLACPENIIAVYKKHNPELLKAVRQQFQLYLNRMAKPFIESGEMESKQIDSHDEKQFFSFTHNLLSLYPLLEPETGESFKLPKKIDSVWQFVDYEFKRIDISPQSGIVAKLLTDDKDRLFAYALTAKDPKVEPYLLFSGTTFDVGQGARLASLSNITPRYSSGESHDMTKVDEWVYSQSQKIITAGQSQGAVLAMITAARFCSQIKAAYCLNPTALSKNTLARFLPKWKEMPEEKRPAIIVYTQQHDPIFSIEKGFLPGTSIYRVIPDTDRPSINATMKLKFGSLSVPIPRPVLKEVAKRYEAHVHLYTGHRQVLMLKLDVDRENSRRWRELTTNAKLFTTSLTYPSKQLSFLTDLYDKKHAVTPIQKKCIVAGLVLILAAVLNEAMKNPRLAAVAVALLAFMFMVVPQVESEVVYRRAMGPR